MSIQEFQYVPTRWAKLAVLDTTTQPDVDALFASVDTSGWVTRPAWDSDAKTLRWQVMASPYGQTMACGSGWVVCVERPYVNGVAAPATPQAQVIAYEPGVWTDGAVSYLP